MVRSDLILDVFLAMKLAAFADILLKGLIIQVVFIIE